MTAKKLFAECNLRTVFACKLRLKYLTTKSALTQNRVAASRAEPYARARRQIRVQQRTRKRRGGSRPLKRRTRTHASLPLALCALALIFQACAPARPGDARGKVATPANAPRPGAAAAVDPFDEYMRAEFAPADGFDFPFGDGEGGGSYTDIATGKRYAGWYKATRFAEEYGLGIHTGEDWNGAGGGNTDLGQPVYAVANGRVVFAEDCGRLWGNVVVLEHIFYENRERREIRSLYAHLHEIKVRAGEEVRRRQLIATVGQDPEKLFGAHLHLELRRDASTTRSRPRSSSRAESSSSRRASRRSSWSTRRVTGCGSTRAGASRASTT
jgi:murein DD-endopeptidase MepM/ murein hydrolase activator NlpD